MQNILHKSAVKNTSAPIRQNVKYPEVEFDLSLGSEMKQ